VIVHTFFMIHGLTTGAFFTLAIPPPERHRSRRRLGGVLAALGLLGASLMIGCQWQPPRMGLAMHPWPGYAYFTLAQARQHYDPRRLTLDVRSLSDNDRAVQAYIGGAAQAIATTAIDVVTICGVAPER
jgi:NitT/TauT family transport system substrate-binding protein